jgi:hypothetical protein
VADIVAGQLGVAPGATLLGVKVCSAISTACSGVALIQGMDFALDPNGDGLTNDKADIFNMSLGSDYGQAGDDDLSAAVEVGHRGRCPDGRRIRQRQRQAVHLGHAGRRFDGPVGRPDERPVAEGFAMSITAPPAIAGNFEAVFQPWSTPLDEVIAGGVQYATGAGGNRDGCAAFSAGSVTGKIVFVDRGNVQLQPEDLEHQPGRRHPRHHRDDRPRRHRSPAPTAATGRSTSPGYMVSQSVGKPVPEQHRHDPGCGSIRPTRSRSSRSRSGRRHGVPRWRTSSSPRSAHPARRCRPRSARPPDARRSAARPARHRWWRARRRCSAALPRPHAERDQGGPHQHRGDRDPQRPTTFGGADAAITRIGGGEVRVDRAFASKVAAWDQGAPTAALGFGFHDITEATTELTRTVVVKNYTSTSQTFDNQLDVPLCE